MKKLLAIIGLTLLSGCAVHTPGVSISSGYYGNYYNPPSYYYKPVPYYRSYGYPRGYYRHRHH